MAAAPLRFNTMRAQYIKRVGPGWFSSIVARYGTMTLGYGKSDAVIRRYGWIRYAMNGLPRVRVQYAKIRDRPCPTPI